MEARSIKKNSKDFWDEKYSRPESVLKEPSAFLMEHLEGFSPKSKALDLACGTGRNAVALALKGFEVSAIDFSDLALEKAKDFAAESGVEIQWKKMDLDFYIPELLSFDLIVAVDFKPPPTLLNNLIRGLKKGGKLMIDTPLLAAMKTDSNLESFECFQAGELLKALQKPGLNFRILYYSELSETRVQLIAMKTEML